MGCSLDSVRQAFDAPDWRPSADAFYQASGLSLFVADFSEGECLFSSGRCGCCHLALDAIEPSPLECYGRLPNPGEAVHSLACRAGLTTYLAPVVRDGGIVAHVVVSGFVSSTRERRRLYEHLIGRGVKEEAARLSVRAMPAITRREIEAFTRLAVSLAQSALATESARGSVQPATAPARPAAASTQRAAAPSQTETPSVDVDALAHAAFDVAGVLNDPGEASRRLLASALKCYGASAGTIAMSRPAGFVEVIAAQGDGVRPEGTKLRLEGGAASRALSSGRTVVVTGGSKGGVATRACTVVAPLVMGDAPVGTLELRMPGNHRLDAAEIRHIEQFARFVALVIAHVEQDEAA